MAADDWTAIFTAATAAATMALAIVAWYQISQATHQTKGWQTLAACEKYESDAVLDRCARRLFFARKSGSFATDPPSYRVDVTTILNYLDGLAIGIDQNLYVKEIVRDHLEPIIKWHVDTYLNPSQADKIGIQRTEYARLIELCEGWNKAPPSYRGR